MQDILLNLVPGAFSPEVHLSQYDKGRVIPFKLVDDKSAYSVPEGAIVKVKATKPSGLGFVVNCTADGDRVTIENTETMSNEFGRFPAELSIAAEGVLLGTANFVFNVERSPHPEGTTDGDAEKLIPEITLLVERAEQAASNALSAKESALAAQSNAETAKDQALAAQSNAETAKDQATSANTDAQAAKTSAETAKASAESAAARAESAASNAEELLSACLYVDDEGYICLKEGN